MPDESKMWNPVDGESIHPISGITLTALRAESIRAEMKHGSDHVLTNPDMPDIRKLAAVFEEAGEVAELFTYDKMVPDQNPLNNPYTVLVVDRPALIKELIQLSMLAAAWAQCEDQKLIDAGLREAHPKSLLDPE